MNLELLKFRYENLTSDIVDNLGPKDAEMVATSILAQKARVKEGGNILSWGDFNENPDPLVNRLLARIIVHQFDRSMFYGLKPNQIAVLSIESSAAYLASEVSHETGNFLHLSRPPRIVRARKLPPGETPSPAMGEKRFTVDVKPITAGGGKRTLIASLPEDDPSLLDIRAIIVVDDFKATRSTLNGGTQLAINMFDHSLGRAPLIIIPTAGLGKPDQEKYPFVGKTNAIVHDVITAMDVRFWAESSDSSARLQVNGFQPLTMQNATAANFASAGV